MKRLIAGVLTGLVGVVVALAAVAWYAQTRKVRQMIRERVELGEKMASLGDVNIDPSRVTLGELNDLLRLSPDKLNSTSNYTLFGWACSGELCAINASFAVPHEVSVPPSTVPAVLSVSKTVFGKPFPGSIGGIHLGDPVDGLLAVCRQHDDEMRKGPHRAAWDKDWDVSWVESEDHKVAALFFLNMSIRKGGSTNAKERAIENQP